MKRWTKDGGDGGTRDGNGGLEFMGQRAAQAGRRGTPSRWMRQCFLEPKEQSGAQTAVGSAAGLGDETGGG